MTLAEIIAEGERLHAEHAVATMVRSLRTADMLARFYSEHGPRLLAVAKAGRTLAAAVAGTGSCAEELAAFDAAVRGEGKETTP